MQGLLSLEPRRLLLYDNFIHFLPHGIVAVRQHATMWPFDHILMGLQPCCDVSDDVSNHDPILMGLKPCCDVSCDVLIFETEI